MAAAAESNPFQTLDRRGADGSLGAKGRITVSSEAKPEAMAALLDQLDGARPIRQRRDSDYFAWRLAKPLSTYRFLFWEDATLEGFLILQTARFADFLEHRIPDLRGTSPAVKRDLLYAVRDRGGLDDLVVWTSSLPEEDRALFGSAGFKPMDESSGVKGFRRTLMVRSVDDRASAGDWTLSGRALLDLANWDIRMLDSDAY